MSRDEAKDISFALILKYWPALLGLGGVVFGTGIMSTTNAMTNATQDKRLDSLEAEARLYREKREKDSRTLTRIATKLGIPEEER